MGNQMGYAAVIVGALALAGCSSDDSSGKSHGVVVRTEPATASQCPNGGSVVKSGLDQNDNGALDDGEVSSTTM